MRSGERIYPSLVWAYALVKKAVAQAKLACGLLDQQRAKAVARAAEELAEGKLR